MQKTTPLEQRRYSRFTLVEITINNSQKVPRAKFLGNDRLIYFNSICKFGNFKNTFATITSLSKLCLRFGTFFSVGTNKKMNFYKLWQQHKQLKTLKMGEA